MLPCWTNNSKCIWKLKIKRKNNVSTSRRTQEMDGFKTRCWIKTCDFHSTTFFSDFCRHVVGMALTGCLLECAVYYDCMRLSVRMCCWPVDRRCTEGNNGTKEGRKKEGSRLSILNGQTEPNKPRNENSNLVKRIEHWQSRGHSPTADASQHQKLDEAGWSRQRRCQPVKNIYPLPHPTKLTRDMIARRRLPEDWSKFEIWSIGDVEIPTELLPVGHLTVQQRVRWGPRNSSCPRPKPPYNCEHPLAETTTQCDYPLNENTTQCVKPLTETPTQCDYPLTETTTQCDYPLNETTTQRVKPLTETTLYAPRWIQMRSRFTSQNWSSCQNGNLLGE